MLKNSLSRNRTARFDPIVPQIPTGVPYFNKVSWLSRVLFATPKAGKHCHETKKCRVESKMFLGKTFPIRKRYDIIIYRTTAGRATNIFPDFIQFGK